MEEGTSLTRGGPLEADAQRSALPLEPLYTLAVACELIPMPSVRALSMFLWKHRSEFPGSYRTCVRGRRQRLLSLSDVQRIREITITPYHARLGCTRAPRTSALGAIAQRAMS